MAHKDDPGAAPSGLAARLDRLFATMRPTPDREYTCGEVARAVRGSAGPTISATYVWQLRTGRRDNPTKHHLEALAGFFGVTPAYFFEDGAPSSEDEVQLALLAAMRDAEVRAVALRAAGLSRQSMAALLQIVERVSELEQNRETQRTTGAHHASAARRHVRHR
jgi:hypothetical protein